MRQTAEITWVRNWTDAVDHSPAYFMMLGGSTKDAGTIAV